MAWRTVFLAVLAVKAVGFSLMLFIATSDDPEARAIAPVLPILAAIPVALVVLGVQNLLS